VCTAPTFHPRGRKAKRDSNLQDDADDDGAVPEHTVRVGGVGEGKGNAPISRPARL